MRMSPVLTSPRNWSLYGVCLLQPRLLIDRQADFIYNGRCISLSRRFVQKDGPANRRFSSFRNVPTFTCNRSESDLRSCEATLAVNDKGSPEKKSEASTGFELMTSAIPVRCSTDWAMKPRWKQVRCEFTYEGLSNRTRFETETKGNSEIAYPQACREINNNNNNNNSNNNNK